MTALETLAPDAISEVLEAIHSFPTERMANHCGASFEVNPLSIYSRCPTCGTRIKLRAFSAGPDVEDIFDAVLEWASQPKSRAYLVARRKELEADA